MKIVYVASEMMPFAKTGGLADVAGTLPPKLQALGYQVYAFVPRYKNVDPVKWGMSTVVDQLPVPVGSEKETARILRCRREGGLEVFLVDKPDLFQRDGIYGTAMGDFPDNDRRYTFFQRAVLEFLLHQGIAPDVIHCQDWQTGLIPVYIKTTYAGQPLFRDTRTVLTVHNLGYQGNFPPDSLPGTGLSWDQFRVEKLEFYGKVSFLKGGLVYADSVTTVSERYSREIQTEEFGSGMHGILSKRADSLYGVVNGIDDEEWDPASDRDLAAPYDVERIAKKALNKNALQRENGFRTDDGVPLLGIVSRLADRKGIDILIPALEEILAWGMQFVLLGTGDEKYHEILREIAKRNRGRVGVHIVFDPKMAKRIYAGSDMLMIPSHYEPCGLAQMIALRYGTIPIARATGGLVDTVTEFDPAAQKGDGFLFEEYSSAAALAALKRALDVYADKAKWLTLVRNAMSCDYSWNSSAKKYVQIYKMTKRRPVPA